MSLKGHPMKPGAEKVRKQLIEIARSLATRHADGIRQLKAKAKELSQPDWFWHSLLISASTWGNSRGYKGLIQNKVNYKRLSFATLKGLSVGARKSELRKVLSAAKVRMSDKKAIYLHRNFARVEQFGGPSATKRHLLKLKGKDAKIKFLQTFDGIGWKYSLNMMMDVYHPDFRECVAVDARIKGVSKGLGLTFKSTPEEAQFYLGVAHDAKLEGWVLDRLMYHCKDEFICALKPWDIG